MIVAIIPARGGSKRIPRKNIREFAGKPMIAWSIEAAREACCFDKIVVSTDDEEIASVAKMQGAEVPFLRPDNLSDDFTGTVPVISHAVNWLNTHMEKVAYACCIYATAPFVRPEDLREGLRVLEEEQCDYAFSVTSFPFPIQRAIRITEQGCTQMFNPEMFNIRSQDLEEAWHDAGQFYWGTAEAWLSEKIIFSESSHPVKLPMHRVQDIDTPEDWERAEYLFEVVTRSGSRS
jgi:pseudaminic acid cytidylyltransferase